MWEQAQKIIDLLVFIAWKVDKYGVFSGPYFPVFGLNTGKYRPEKNSAMLNIFSKIYEKFVLENLTS